MIDENRLMLGDASSNYNDAQISLCLKWAIAEIEDYCNRELNSILEIMAMKITIIKLNRINSEGISAQSYSGVSESFLNGYPQEILNVLNKNRKLKVV